MRQREAFRETILMAEAVGMPDHAVQELGLPHLRAMFARITDDFSEAKLGRWLGWAQCALVAAGVGVTLEDMKELNRKWSDQLTTPDKPAREALPATGPFVDRIVRIFRDHPSDDTSAAVLQDYAITVLRTPAEETDLLELRNLVPGAITVLRTPAEETGRRRFPILGSTGAPSSAKEARMSEIERYSLEEYAGGVGLEPNAKGAWVRFTDHQASLAAVTAERDRMVEATKDALAALVAAHSLLSRSPKKAAPSDKMFDIMLSDYAAAIERTRAALTASGLSIVPVASGDVVERVARAWASIDGKTEAFDREKDGSVNYDDPAHTGHYDGYVEEAKELLKRSGLASTLESLAAENARLREDGRNMKAALIARANTLLRLRNALTEVYDNIADEGDRVYFGSTNDAEALKDVWQELDGWAWEDIIDEGKLPDVYEASRKAHARAEAAEAANAELRAAARRIVPYLRWTISDESPGYHPTMPSAVGAFVTAFGWPNEEAWHADRIDAALTNTEDRT